MPARVLFCPVKPHPAAVEAISKYAPQAEVVDVSGSNYDYWNSIAERWTGERDLIIVEQDIEIGPETIATMESCKQDWCCYAYTIFRTKVRLRVGLGCVKISAAAQRKVTAAMVAEGFTNCAACRGKGCWWHLDGQVAHMMKRGGFFPHVHGDVVHHHDYDTGMVEGVDIGIPMEWHYEEGGDMSPALVINPDLMAPMQLATDPRLAGIAAKDMMRVGERLAADSSLMTPLRGVFGASPYASLMMPMAPIKVKPQAGAYDTDKVDQGYMPAYNAIADQLSTAGRICEVGVLAGGSLATWKDLFPDGIIAGVDQDPEAHWPPGTIKIVAGQDDPGLPAMLAQHSQQWDMIVDDASHDGDLTAATFGLLWPMVSPGGFYVIEDWFVGFADYHGTCRSPAMLTLAQSLLERLHRDTDTESVTYRYGMAIIRKKG